MFFNELYLEFTLETYIILSFFYSRSKGFKNHILCMAYIREYSPRD